MSGGKKAPAPPSVAGFAPLSGKLFDKSAMNVDSIKMTRKPDSDMSQKDTQAVVELMNYLLDKAAD